MTTAIFVRAGGVVAILAGILRIMSAIISNSDSVAVKWLYPVIDIAFAISLMSLYGFQRQEIGRWGIFSFVVAELGAGLLIVNDLSGSHFYSVAALTFTSGISLLAIVSWQPKRLPHWISAFWIMSTLVGLMGYFLPTLGLLFIISGIIFGIGYAGAGVRIWQLRGGAGDLYGLIPDANRRLG
ncbi:MAG: hypothetical protein H0X30_25850 [Anaerolineae bacterium]|nr:hypothetical protein [Anaerolineae bacterium]